MPTPTYIVVTVSLNDDDTPERPLSETMAAIIEARIPGVVDCQAAAQATPYSWLVPVGTVYA